MEQWSPLLEYPGYSVSDAGRVMNERRGAILTPARTRSNHTFVGLMQGGIQVKRSVAKLVCETFVPNVYSDLFNTPIHLNGDLANNHAMNLLWRPRWFAVKYTQQFNKKLIDTQPVRNKDTGDVFERLWDLVMTDGVLYNDVILAIHYETYVFPTRHHFEWIY